MNIKSAESSLQSTTFEYEAIFHKVVGVWPGDDYFLARYSRIRGYVLAAFAVVVCVFQFTALLEANSDDVPENDFINLMRMTKEINEFSTLTDEEETIHIDWQSVQDKLMKIISRYYFLTVIGLYFVAPMFRNALPLRGIVPEVLRVTPWFQMIYVLQCLLLLSNVITSISSDAFSVTFMCQLCKQLELVQCSIKHLGSHTKVNLAETINRHAVALDYGQRVCNTLKTMFLLQHIFISMFLCFAGVIVLNTQNSLILMKMIVISVIFVSTLLIICFVGETITSSSLKIASATESSNYEIFLGDVSTLRTVSFILCRAQKPLRMAVSLSGSMNLSFFTETMNKLVSAFMILRTMME
ncbi:odorant receptor 294 [Nasonia vitripennis]|uniref:Odorant receptor n=1 Tax=Nasonia vitripennis TaxID=7425 RepID=A0A7M6USK2_NASVI|nr:odorant receptor 294 [Nasonia vitripennis]